MQEVEAMCDRVIIINKGKIVADDKITDLQEKHPGKSMEDIFRTLTNKKMAEEVSS